MLEYSICAVSASLYLTKDDVPKLGVCWILNSIMIIKFRDHMRIKYEAGRTVLLKS